MTDKICIDADATAFEEWARLVNIYDSMPTVEDAFAAGLRYGKAHGAAMEREAILNMITNLNGDIDLMDRWSVVCTLIMRRIRQRGEK